MLLRIRISNFGIISVDFLVLLKSDTCYGFMCLVKNSLNGKPTFDVAILSRIFRTQHLKS